jgi:hypothetical protein
VSVLAQCGSVRVAPFGHGRARGWAILRRVTTYAFDPRPRHLVAVWETGTGALARTAVRLHPGVDEAAATGLARALTALSATTWRAYTDPDLILVDPAAALAALRDPHLPEDGLLLHEPDPHREAAHEVGRRLLAVGGAGLARQVAAEVAEDLDALDRALRGDLSGRARQAVGLTRLDASPLQVVAADRILHEVPVGDARLFVEVEPTAAAVAAAHWLRSAVDVVLAASGWADPEQVLVAADAIEEFEVAPARAVLDLMAAGAPPLAAVRCLVRAAMLAARGVVLPHGPGERPDEPRRTVLDPARPAPGLLEHLVAAIRSVSLVHTAHLDPAALGPGSWPRRRERLRRAFDEQVRAEAGRTADRLLRSTPTAPTP